MSYKKIKSTILTATVVLLALSLAGCGKKQDPEEIITDENATDQMWSELVTDAEIYIFGFGSDVYTFDEMLYPVECFDDSIVDGGFYKVTADINYLNGGIAGYVNFPEIKSVSKVEEVSPLDISLPSITDKQYGLLLIGDYADGDVFLNEDNITAVWKDGEWIWKYDSKNRYKTDDGAIIYMASGVSREQALEGMDSGVLACEDYFVVPSGK